MEKLILLTSNDKIPDQSQTNSDFTIELKDSYQTQNVKRVLIKDISVPNVFYNVREGKSAPGSGTANADFVFQETGQPVQTVTVPEGNYTTATYITALEALMNGVLVGGTVAITQSSLTQRLTFTLTGTTINLFSIDDPTNPNPAANIVGITQSVVAISAITFASLPDLSGVKLAYVHCREVAESHGIDGGFGLISVAEDISFHDTQFGATAFRKNDDSELALIEYSTPRNLSSLRIVLRDDRGAKLNIGTSQMAVIIKVFYAD
jgi:hypothetical protein